ncbi:YggT family protein [Humitalea rosea]|uniref:YggT family protein n=1 Tax=Humitalea rosea TaxID=990373 RepID=A0A2W7IHZ5_9PROT|nr:YggT family protein [Humitalea rosea]PZW45610.1 YggT family protein [Humitalea rosea]
MYALFWLLDRAASIYVWTLIIASVVSMLVGFGVLDRRNRFVWGVEDFLYRVTEPALRPLRRVLPTFGAVDLSPLVLILLLYAFQIFLWTTLWPLFR